VPLDSRLLEDADFNYRDIFDLVRLREMRWGGRTIATTLGSPQLLVCYRADWFESNGLSPPADWDAYQQAVERFAQLPSHAGIFPTIEPFADGWAGHTLLARAASYAMHREQLSPLFRLGTVEPLVDQPPYVRALEELVASAKAAKGSELRNSPEEAFEALLSGRCAMAVTWPTGGTTGNAPAGRDGKLAFAALPVSRQAYRFSTGTWEDRVSDDSGPVPLLSIAGRMAAVSASSRNAARAGGLVVWLAGRDASDHVAAHSAATTLFRRSQVAQSSRWMPQLTPDESRHYAETLAASLSAARAMAGITLPGRQEYLAALDRAVQEALAGKPGAEALSEASTRWRGITEKLGVEAQRKALAHSLGQGNL
jgi:multiple sugar transport system substrate-binding protein